MKHRILSMANVFLLSLMLLIFIPIPAQAIDMELGSNPVQLDICNGSISVVSSADTVTYSQGEHNWTSTGGCVITQSDVSAPTSNRITLGGSANSMEIKITITNLNI